MLRNSSSVYIIMIIMTLLNYLICFPFSFLSSIQKFCFFLQYFSQADINIYFVDIVLTRKHLEFNKTMTGLSE